jgi:hypothetical protein
MANKQEKETDECAPNGSETGRTDITSQLFIGGYIYHIIS